MNITFRVCVGMNVLLFMLLMCICVDMYVLAVYVLLCMCYCERVAALM